MQHAIWHSCDLHSVRDSLSDEIRVIPRLEAPSSRFSKSNPQTQRTHTLPSLPILSRSSNINEYYLRMKHEALTTRVTNCRGKKWTEAEKRKTMEETGAVGTGDLAVNETAIELVRTRERKTCRPAVISVWRVRDSFLRAIRRGLFQQDARGDNAKSSAHATSSEDTSDTRARDECLSRFRVQHAMKQEETRRRRWISG